MYDIIKRDKRVVKVGLLGASFDTGNLGVNALAESSIKCIYHRWENAEIILLGAGRFKGRCVQKISGIKKTFQKQPIRFSANVFMGNHIFMLILCGLILKYFRFNRLRRFCCKYNHSVRRLVSLDIVADITAGDSFSDSYGVIRFFKGFLIKWMLLLYDKPLILLPQTYGPFKNRIVKKMASYILRRAALVYSRDDEGVQLARMMLNNQGAEKVNFLHDVAFVLDPQKPDKACIAWADQLDEKGKIVVGVNVSGLLFNGGYNRSNMFGLKFNYRDFIFKMIDKLMLDESIVVVLLPHVYPPEELQVESDLNACLNVYHSLSKKYKDRIFTARGVFSHTEVKYLIGKCNFFIGSRMHSCIAALSQCIPAVGVAYSKKFRGVFDTIGLAACVADAREHDEDGILDMITSTFNKRDSIQEHLKSQIPQVKANILSLFYF